VTTETHDPVLVTGAAGFIGGHVAARLARAGSPVVALDLPGSDWGHLHGLAGLQTREADIADAEALERALSECAAGAVVHCAALMGSAAPEAIHRANVVGTHNIGAWAAAHKATRFVYLSSVTVHGLVPVRGIDEDTPFARIGMPYADSKMDAESEVARLHHQGIRWTILRPGDVYGPRAGEWVLKLVAAMRQGRMALIGGGSGLINITHVDNLADAIEAALRAPQAAGRVYLITDGEPVTWKRYLDALASTAGCAPATRSIPTWIAWPATTAFSMLSRLTGWRPPITPLGLRLMTARCSYSIDRARRELHWTPRVTFEAGMEEIGRWLKSSVPRPG
jgi:nucleoside-diphosphate-sugar epimerase